MKNILFTFCLCCTFYSATAQTHLYIVPGFESIVFDHQTIGIVPFDATITLRPKQMKDITPEQLDRMDLAEGAAVQKAMYSWFLKREKRGQLTVKVQDPKTTMAKLSQNGVTAENMDSYTPQDLAQIMGVDAIINGSFETNKPMSEGASVAIAALFGFYGNTNQAVMNLFIHNAADGEVIVNYNKKVNGSLGSSPDDLINILMRKASRRIPYTQK